MPGTGATVGTGVGAAAGTAIMPGVGTVVGGMLGGVVGGLFDSNEAPAAPRGEYMPIDPNVGIGTGSFGLTPEEQAYYERVRAEQIARYGDPAKLQQNRDAAQLAYNQYVDEWRAKNPQTNRDTFDPVENSRGAVTPQARREAEQRAMEADPRFKELKQALTVADDQFRAVNNLPGFDMSDPGRFAAMSQAMQNRQGLNLPQFSVANTAAPDIYQMQRQNAPMQVDPGAVQRAQTFNAREFAVDPEAGAQDYANYQATRAKNLEVMGAVGDRAMGRGGPSPAELQMKQGQDRAIAQQAALAASGGQMDSAMARRQAMLGAAQIGQRTASDTALLRANEQIAAQTTFGGMANAQQSADLNARGQTYGQAMSNAQFGSDQSFRNAQFNASQAQFNAGQANQYALQRAQQLAQQGQFGAQFGLEQERAYAQSLAQQRQWNAQFQQGQNQFGATFGAQQAMNQAGLSMQQRQLNDQMTGMYLNQYMGSRGMQQANAFQNQNAYNQMAGINAGIGINNANNAAANQRFQQQQQLGMLNMGATMAAGYMGQGGGGSPAPAVANSGFNQSDPNKINWGY